MCDVLRKWTKETVGFGIIFYFYFCRCGVFFSVNIFCGIAAGKVMGRAIIIGKTVFFLLGSRFLRNVKEGRREAGGSF